MSKSTFIGYNNVLFKGFINACEFKFISFEAFIIRKQRYYEKMSRKNYTEREKRELLTIVDKYKAIIENKSTNAVTVEQKNNTWEKIAQQYNSSAENPRTAKQLNTAYQNLKRLTRQKTAEDNKQNYMEKKFKKDKVEDKKAIMATGGGTFTPKLSEVGAQMLALMGDQLIPLANNYDSASDYFGRDKDEDGDNENKVISEIIQESDDHKIETCLGHHEIEVSAEPPLLEESKVVPPKEVQKKKTNPSSSRPSSLHIKNRQHIYLKEKKKVESTSCIKRKFYQKKLECALLEKKTNLVNYRISMKKEKLIDLEIKIKELEFASQAK